MVYVKNVGIDPPGTYIKIELEARGWTQRDLAFILGQSEQQLNPLLSGKRAITPDMARLLGDAFGVSPQFFANLQTQFDLANAKEPDPAVKTRAGLQNTYPVRDMIRRGWIKDGEASLLQLQVDRFFEGESEQFAFAAKKTQYEEVTPHQKAWVYRVRQLARSTELKAYSENKLRSALSVLHSFMLDPEAAKDVPHILADCGVRFVIVEALPGAKIDGVCTWLDDYSPVIGLSTLYDRLDNFWFVLRHEIEHVLRGDGKSTLGIVDNLSGDDALESLGMADEEREANRAAEDFCIPSQKMESFYLRKHPYFSERDVIGFASVVGVHPAIVVGQLQKKMGRYDYLRKYQVPIRKHILPHALADGWGSVAEAEL